MTPEAAFHRVFDVSERIPNVVIGWLALVMLGAFVITLLVPGWRAWLLSRWWLLPMVAGPMFVVVSVRELGLWVLVWGIAFVAICAASELRGTRLRWSPRLGGSEAPAGFVGLISGLVLLAGAAFGGVSQTGAVSLWRQLEAGQGVVLIGPVQDYVEVAPAGNNDCFSVENRRFCLSNWVMTPGFRETRFSGTPLSDGEIVRLSVIGEAIVRVEVEQTTPSP